MRAKISELADQFSELADTEKTNTEKALKCERMIETVQKESDRNFEKFSEKHSLFIFFHHMCFRSDRTSSSSSVCMYVTLIDSDTLKHSYKTQQQHISTAAQ